MVAYKLAKKISKKLDIYLIKIKGDEGIKKIKGDENKRGRRD
jgi:hypothetical protein